MSINTNQVVTKRTNKIFSGIILLKIFPKFSTKKLSPAWCMLCLISTCNNLLKDKWWLYMYSWDSSISCSTWGPGCAKSTPSAPSTSSSHSSSPSMSRTSSGTYSVWPLTSFLIFHCLLQYKHLFENGIHFMYLYRGV